MAVRSGNLELDELTGHIGTNLDVLTEDHFASRVQSNKGRSENGCQASATLLSRPAGPQSLARFLTRVGAKKNAGVGPGRSPASTRGSSQCVKPTSMLWTSWARQ